MCLQKMLLKRINMQRCLPVIHTSLVLLILSASRKYGNTYKQKK